MESQTFTLPTALFDERLLPAGARDAGTPAFREAVGRFFAESFAGFGGRVEVVVRDEKIIVSWHTDPTRQNPLQTIVQRLQRGEWAESIQLLNLLLSRSPDDVDIVYNLGLALSQTGQLDLAEAHLRRVVELAPDFVNGLAALGTMLTRQQRNEEAKALLEAAARLEPKNHWVLRNLGVVLMKTGQPVEAAAHFREAVTHNLTDQGSWIGLADALALAGDKKKAEEAYRHAMALNPHNDLGEAARAGLGNLAESGFRAKVNVGLSPDAVQYCSAALRKFSEMSDEEVKRVAMEIATAGREGFDVDSPVKRHQLKSLPGDFSGLQMLCYMHVAFQRIAPGTDLGFDLTEEYKAAKSQE